MCELCNSPVLEGELGESKYVCTNRDCERSNPYWAKENMRNKLQPYYNAIKQLSKFTGGTIEFYEARWRGDGSAEITLANGTNFICHVENEKFTPFDEPFFDELNLDITNEQILQIKKNMLEYIKVRENCSKLVF